MRQKLKGHRLAQLRLLQDAGAVNRRTAVCASFGGGYRPGPLSRMIGEGLVEHAQLPFKGDTRRRTSHYWLTARGRRALLGQPGE